LDAAYSGNISDFADYPQLALILRKAEWCANPCKSREKTPVLSRRKNLLMGKKKADKPLKLDMPNEEDAERLMLNTPPPKRKKKAAKKKPSR
jgi:hypothetical protein